LTSWKFGRGERHAHYFGGGLGRGGYSDTCGRVGEWCWRKGRGEDGKVLDEESLRYAHMSILVKKEMNCRGERFKIIKKGHQKKCGSQGQKRLQRGGSRSRKGVFSVKERLGQKSGKKKDEEKKLELILLPTQRGRRRSNCRGRSAGK